jgi:hypothetical protein
MIIDSHHPLFFFDDCINLSDLRRQLHTGFYNTLKILEDEGIAVYRLAFGLRHRYYIRRDAARPIILHYGSEAARKRRLSRSAAKPKGTPLWMACPHCGQKGKQWRSGLNTAGNREAKCGHCKRFYTIGKRPPLTSTCVHCGETTRQWRQQVTSAGNQTIRCGHCKRHYTMKGDPDAELAAAQAVVVPRPWVEEIRW